MHDKEKNRLIFNLKKKSKIEEEEKTTSHVIHQFFPVA
jgi:hypothetical protein